TALPRRSLRPRRSPPRGTFPPRARPHPAAPRRGRPPRPAPDRPPPLAARPGPPTPESARLLRPENGKTSSFASTQLPPPAARTPLPLARRVCHRAVPGASVPESRLHFSPPEANPAPPLYANPRFTPVP